MFVATWTHDVVVSRTKALGVYARCTQAQHSRVVCETEFNERETTIMANAKRNAGIKVKGFDAFNFEEFAVIHYGLNSCKLVGMERYPEGNQYRKYAHVVLHFVTAEAGPDVIIKKSVRLYDTKPVKWVNPETKETKYFDSPAKQFCDSVARANGGITANKGINKTLEWLATEFTPCFISREVYADKEGHPVLNDQGNPIEYDKLTFNIPDSEEKKENPVRLNQDDAEC